MQENGQGLTSCSSSWAFFFQKQSKVQVTASLSLTVAHLGSWLWSAFCLMTRWLVSGSFLLHWWLGVGAAQNWVNGGLMLCRPQLLCTYLQEHRGVKGCTQCCRAHAWEELAPSVSLPQSSHFVVAAFCITQQPWRTRGFFPMSYFHLQVCGIETKE